jgi:UDP-glucose 4-epimerase
MTRVLVTGGAGFIGSHSVVALAEAGHEPIVVDDFSNSDPSVCDRLATVLGREIECHAVDVCDEGRLDEVFAAVRPDAVIHFAGLKAVGESVAEPLRYYRTNLGATMSLAAVMRRRGVDLLIFSSSATVYSPAAVSPVREDAPLGAVNPYGQTKVMNEQILRDLAAHGGPSRMALLRYFNPVGAHPSGLIGEQPRGVPNNLAPYVVQVAAGRQPVLRVWGADYPTPDGTCQRDYIHVLDLAAGHVAALAALRASDPAVHTWNLGTGRPTSVLEMVAAFSRAVGRPIPYELAERRPGDMAVTFADPSRANAELGWSAERGIDEMCADAWRWEQQRPVG